MTLQEKIASFKKLESDMQNDVDLREGYKTALRYISSIEPSDHENLEKFIPYFKQCLKTGVESEIKTLTERIDRMSNELHNMFK